MGSGKDSERAECTGGRMGISRKERKERKERKCGKGGKGGNFAGKTGIAKFAGHLTTYKVHLQHTPSL